MKDKTWCSGSLGRAVTLTLVCVAACASPSDGETTSTRERVGTVSQRVTTTLLHSFAGGAAGAASPQSGEPLVLGSTLYGMTLGGGPAELGTVFKVNTDGTGFAVLRSFAGGASDGSRPYGSLVASGSTLYGMTQQGGASSRGTVFKVNTDGTGFALLHSFAGGASDGLAPYGSLVASGATLYGMTPQGGASHVGTVFKINTDGTGFALLHSFAGGSGDGSSPLDSLTVSGSTLYGVTGPGGASNQGTVFKVNTDGTGFALLRSFAGGAGDGSSPSGSLTASGATLYGTTSNGGASGVGTVFKINTDGTGFALLRSFVVSATDPTYPRGPLVALDSTLYGMSSQGGVSRQGTVFKVNTDGTGFAVLRSFAGGASDGSRPYGSLTASGSTLYGMTRQGGASDRGTVFRMDLRCALNEHVAANACVACAAGSTRLGGDDPEGADTSCTATVCAVDERVVSNACVACPPGSTRLAGDLATEANTACDATVCAVDEHVVSNACVACAPGGTRLAGDLATGANTACANTICDVNEYVANHTCTPCALGSMRAAGDLATGGDTTCAAITCAVNQYVSRNACVACAPGSTRAAGDLATGGDTTCAGVTCAANQYVADHACVACAPGGTRPAGDQATGPNTACTNAVCAANEYVAKHACTACALGSTRAAGDLATGADTACAITTCAADQSVASHACVPCPAGSTRPAGDLATGPDTVCAPSQTRPSDAAGAPTAPADVAAGGGCTVAGPRPLSSRASVGVAAFAALALAAMRRRRRGAAPPRTGRGA